MKYFAIYDGEILKEVGIAYGNITKDYEITEAEYNALLAEIREKAALVDKLYSGEITIDAVPVAWQEEIQRRVDERRAWESEIAETAEATDEDYLAALAELGVTV